MYFKIWNYCICFHVHLFLGKETTNIMKNRLETLNFWFMHIQETLSHKQASFILLADKTPQPLACVKLRKFFTYSGSLFPFDIYRNAVKQNEVWCSVINKSGVHNIHKEEDDMQENMCKMEDTLLRLSTCKFSHAYIT